MFAHEQKNENVVVSPYSAYTALCMTTNGAHGKTRQEMAETLGFTADEMDAINKRNLKIMNALQTQSDTCKIEIANAIFADQNFPFKESFKAKCGEFYHAEAQSLNFKSPEALATVNSWCKEKTHGKIEKILERLTPAEKLVLLNTVYFKSKWQTPFKKDATRLEPFLVGVTKQDVQTMHAVFHLPYLKADGFEAIAMPYKEQKQSLYVFLPEQSSDVKKLVAKLSADNWKSWLSTFGAEEVELALPKVKVNYSTDLTDTLKQIGMAPAFLASADFSEMIAPPKSANISKVVQKTFLEIDEEGTEAAAATAVVMEARAMMMRPKQRVQFKVDRPFVIALVDNSSQEILFLGAISDPQGK